MSFRPAIPPGTYSTIYNFDKELEHNMEFSDILKQRRSIRRFKQQEIPLSILTDLIDAAAVAPSGANNQPLRYVLIREKELLKAVFEQTAWGGHVRPRRDPEFGVTSPTAFLAVCAADQGNQTPTPAAAVDAGAAIQSILFRAVDLGLGACWIGAFNRRNVNELLRLDGLTAIYLVGLGYPAETPVLQRIRMGDSTKYFLDEQDVIHVPKYTVNDILSIR